MNKWKDEPFVNTDSWGFDDDDEPPSPWEMRLLGLGVIASAVLVLWAVFS